jgi:uncharacterized protein
MLPASRGEHSISCSFYTGGATFPTHMTNVLIAITGFGFSLLAVVIDVFSSKIDLLYNLTSGISLWIQTAVGFVLTPLLVGAVHRITTNSSCLAELTEMSKSLVQRLNPSFLQISALSIAAGFGEEILFRGAFQPLIGLIPASVFFAGLHTGFRFDRHVYRLYFLIVFFISILLGLTARYIGLPAAMIAHGTWDFTMILLVKREISKTPSDDFTS